MAAVPPRRGETADELVALADAAASGDRAAVRAFLVGIGPQLLRVVRRVLGPEHPEMEAVLQASAFAVVEALPRRRRESIVSHFACRHALLAAVNVRRREAARTRRAAHAHELEADAPATAIRADLAHVEQSGVHVVQELMVSLPLAEAEVLALNCMLGYSPREIAESADIPLETVRDRLGAVKHAVRERLSAGDPPLPEELAESPELRLLHEAGVAFDVEAPVLADDDERIERMTSRVMQSTRSIRLSPRELLALKSSALALLVAGVAVAAIEVSRWHPYGARARAPQAQSKDLSHDQRLVPVTPEPASREAPPKNQEPRASASAPSAPAPSASSAIASKYRSASELFADAKRARVDGDLAQAVAISQLLEQTFPNSNEGITTHLSLGVLYLQQGQPNQALGEFKIFRHIGSPALMAEALWGEEQALQQLGQVSEERTVLEELLANYPHSAYVGAAEKRLAALNH